ncbi:MAG: three-Cys-motif partner protein TcmP [Candidatus Nealsonbacteria bacterium]|nr:MAG: three-Cys-motif partner protein TcmP [Candidatus Nealsonbacteria bacterium]
MAIKPEDFFKGKRAWSLAKDRILGWYLVPYLTKVSRLGKLITIVDGFAGPGLYDDGSEGSPFIICKTIEKTGVKAVVILIDSDRDCFEKLERNLKEFVDKKTAILFMGDFNKITPKIIKITKNCPTFFYIDPFGIKGLEFDNLKKIFDKVRIISTEVLINFNYQTLLREYKINPTLTDEVMGGNYYREILEDDKITRDEKERIIIELYKSKYKEFFTYVGSCPVMYKDELLAKYHLIFATSHFDGFRLMNDRMGDIYREFYTKGRLIAIFPKDKRKDLVFLEGEILNFLKNKPKTRKKIKEEFMKKYFLRFKESDYNQVVKELMRVSKIYSDTGKIRINDDNLLAVSTPKK